MADDEIQFYFVFENAKEDPPFETKEEKDMTVKEFMSSLNDQYAALGDILSPNETIYIHTDQNRSVAGGGVAKGGEATSPNGIVAISRGGYAEGGSIKGNSIRGGRSIGGDGEGEESKGRGAFGGNAFTNDPKKTTQAGRGTAGDALLPRQG
ncbi:hypothetical protein VFPPC_03805 [Pochonia chlamydosporia 170]|uniref:Uncharacterized protein n=1 Tax=Pochonia chlamydosporia 170 TaxID=1380566 RepID=A0A179F2B4_METCM|nr:hypothetical protein VFPPC_03805 [Pochonia chlamydosporia 170]OAQ59575.1 hypothetical protein VFPPC_03805 [Pochonia chlamydosporia 170]